MCVRISQCSLGTSRILRAARVKHAMGSLVIKTFTKPDSEIRLRALVRRLQCM